MIIKTMHKEFSVSLFLKKRGAAYIIVKVHNALTTDGDRAQHSENVINFLSTNLTFC